MGNKIYISYRMKALKNAMTLFNVDLIKHGYTVEKLK